MLASESTLEKVPSDGSLTNCLDTLPHLRNISALSYKLAPTPSETAFIKALKAEMSRSMGYLGFFHISDGKVLWGLTNEK